MARGCHPGGLRLNQDYYKIVLFFRNIYKFVQAENVLEPLLFFLIVQIKRVNFLVTKTSRNGTAHAKHPCPTCTGGRHGYGGME
jgi:hypothetical protein